jgi:hypothetical protein
MMPSDVVTPFQITTGMEDQCPILSFESTNARMLSFRICSSALASQRRYQTSGTSTTFITMKKDHASFKKNWLSDSSTYPLLFALGSAIFMAAGVGFSCIANSPDVRISNDTKHSTVRNWGLRP